MRCRKKKEEINIKACAKMNNNQLQNVPARGN
jgi:hypothetical protein